MKAKKQSGVRKYFNAGMAIGGAGIGFGIAAQATEKAGGNAAGVGQVASFLPSIGSATGGAVVVGMLRGLGDEVRKAKGKRRY